MRRLWQRWIRGRGGEARPDLAELQRRSRAQMAEIEAVLERHREERAAAEDAAGGAPPPGPRQ